MMEIIILTFVYVEKIRMEKERSSKTASAAGSMGNTVGVAGGFS
jgi:hypothetical protein